MRSLKVLSVLLVLVGMCSADSKIKTRRTMMGQTMENTVYVKGARQRTEEAGMMGMPSTTTIVQCDLKRIITINTCTKTYMISPMDVMAAAPSPGAAMAAGASADNGAPQKGGVLTIVNDYIDTKERQKMFGLEARHIKTNMSMVASPDACAKTSMKMEKDGWYVSLSPQFTCDAGMHRYAAMGGGRGARPSCRDTVRLKGGMGNPGFPLKETTTMMTEGHPFSMTEEVTELSTANLNPALFDVPIGYREVSDYRAMMGDPRAMMMSGGNTNCGSGIPIEVAGAPAEAAAPAPVPSPAPAAAPAPAPKVTSAPAKASGTLRVGVAKINDKSGQYLPIFNLRLDLMYELQLRKMEAIPLDAETQADAIQEARGKDCDYVLFTDATAIGDPGQPAPHIANPSHLVKAAAVDPKNYNAVLDIALWKPIKKEPQLKASLPGTAPVRAVDAVMNGFENEADAVRKQIDEDLHPKSAPATKPAVHRAPAKKK
jgi:hypothetical protein